MTAFRDISNDGVSLTPMSRKSHLIR